MTTQQTPQKRRITVIPPNPQLTERDIHKKHLRVAPYCRVSTDSEEQLNSYNAQIAYYTEKIAATPEWTMVRLYADEGITGTSMKRRKEFLKMLRDCDRGKIDLIITKSVSRFGRNTLDGLDTVRKLKRKGIGVFFEKENTNTLIDRDTFQRVQEELARRSSLRKTSSKTKTELGKYCGKYVLSELLVCGECGSPYRRVVWSRPEGKRIVWRCINRLEHGKKICKKSPTWNEADIHAAVTAAMNELFHAQTAREALEASITAALAGEDGELSLPALEAQIHSLAERQLELFQLAVSAGPDCLDYDEEIQRVNMAKTSLMAKKAELEREGRTAAAFDRRMEEIASELEQTAGTITEFDEVTVRQLVSNIKVVSKDTLLICFKDGTEITQTI